MYLLKNNKELNGQMDGYSKHLGKREGFKIGKSTIYAKQLQDFQQSGMKPKNYFETVRKKDDRAAETFMLNFKYFVQYQQDQYFEDFHELRWELGRKYHKGGM